MTISVYNTSTHEVIKFKANGDKKMRTAKVRYNEDGLAFFKGFNGMKLWLHDFTRTDSPWGNKSVIADGVIGQYSM